MIYHSDAYLCRCPLILLPVFQIQINTLISKRQVIDFLIVHGSRQDMPQLLYRYSIPFESDPATNSIIAVSYATKMH